MRPTRYHHRSLNRSARRTAVRKHFRQRWRAPDDLAEAMTCFRRAIRARRRLARLAPHHFDSAVVDRDRRKREEERARMALWEPVLEKVYGPPTPAEREAQRQAEQLASQPPPLHPRTGRAVAKEYADWKFWLSAGRLARARHQQRHPHALPSLGRVVSLLEIAMDFGSLATGRDWRRPAPAPEPALPAHDFEADLRRVYGNHSSDVGGGVSAPVPPTASVPVEPIPTEVTPIPVSTPASPDPAPPATLHLPPAEPLRRRDAWSAWARYQSRRASSNPR